MTQEEKAKAYDEAIERAKKWRNAPNADKIPTFANRVIDEIFPELAESEDERIRKILISYFSHLKDADVTEIIHMSGYKLDDILAWLEKQGTSYTKRDVDDAYVEGMAFAKYELEKQGEQKSFDYENANIQQKDFAPKVKPKFKVKYAGSEYNVLETKDIAGVMFYGIEDEPNHIDYVKAENCEIISGYGIKENGFSVPTKPIMFSEEKPKRMISAEAKEAMYSKPAWSEEDERILDALITSLNNEVFAGRLETLKGIGVSLVIDWLKSLKNRYTWKSTDEEMKEALRTEYEKGRADAIAEMQNPTWSEEDECYMSECIGAIATKDGWSFEEKRKTKYWLKSLKDRVQPQKQEWREEDEAHINGIIDYLLNYKLFVYEEDMNVANGVQKELDWLKSLQRIGG